MAKRNQQPIELPKALRLMRRRSEKSLNDLVETLGVTTQAISRWENRTATVPEEKIPLYLQAIGKTQTDLEREMQMISEGVVTDFTAREPARAWADRFPETLEEYTIWDESMAPWGEPGEKILVERNTQPRRHEGCLVEMKDGSALIRLYHKSSDGFVFLQRINPDCVEKILHSNIKGLHRIALRG